VGAAEWTESLCPPAIANIPVGLYVPLLEFNHRGTPISWAASVKLRRSTIRINARMASNRSIPPSIVRQYQTMMAIIA
jgi:hypothetical protein